MKLKFQTTAFKQNLINAIKPGFEINAKVNFSFKLNLLNCSLATLNFLH